MDNIRAYTLKSEDVAMLLGYNVQYVRILARTGRLPAVLRGGTWLFSESEIQQHLERKTSEAIHGNQGTDTDLLR